eukprot:444452-Pelagomonas_calceolata.AAC.7
MQAVCSIPFCWELFAAPVLLPSEVQHLSFRFKGPRNAPDSAFKMLCLSVAGLARSGLLTGSTQVAGR